jgi:hypothetical protein
MTNDQEDLTPWRPELFLTRAELTMTREQLIEHREKIVQAARDTWARRDTAENSAAYRRACDEAAMALHEHDLLKRHRACSPHLCRYPRVP